MRASLGDIYDKTVTIINRLDARDGGTQYDTYYAHTIDNCMWSLVTTRSVDLDGTVTVGTSHRVQIPESELFVPYNEWKSGDRETTFTVRTGDYVVLGEVTEEVTASNIRKVIAAYEPEAFQVQMFRNATKGAGFVHSVRGIRRFIEPYVLEG